MTAPTYSKKDVFQLVSDHLKEYTTFLEVKSLVMDKLEALKESGRIVRYKAHDNGSNSLLVTMWVPLGTPRDVESAVMWEVSDFGLDTGILVDAFTRDMEGLEDEPQGAD
jgi:hypothetical protein